MSLLDPMQRAEAQIAAAFRDQLWLAHHNTENFNTALHFAKRLECADDAFAPCESIAFGYAALAELLTALQPAVNELVAVGDTYCAAAIDSFIP